MLTISKTLGWRYAKKGALNRLNRERSYVQSRLMPRFLPWRTKQNGTVSSAFWKSAVWSRVILSCLKERQADILDKKIYSTISAVNGLSTIFPMASSPCLLDCFPRSITFSLYFCFLCFTFLTPKIEINWQLQSKLAALKFVMRRRLGQKWQLGQSWLSYALKHDTRVASKEKKKRQKCLWWWNEFLLNWTRLWWTGNFEKMCQTELMIWCRRSNKIPRLGNSPTFR